MFKHRVDNEEFYQLLDEDGVSDDIDLFNKKLRDATARTAGSALERANRKVSGRSVLPT